MPKKYNISDAGRERMRENGRRQHAAKMARWEAEGGKAEAVARLHEGRREMFRKYRELIARVTSDSAKDSKSRKSLDTGGEAAP